MSHFRFVVEAPFVSVTSAGSSVASYWRQIVNGASAILLLSTKSKRMASRNILHIVPAMIGIFANSAFANEVIFSPPGCKYSVAFPINPSIRNIAVEGGTSYPEAQVLDERAGNFLRAICIPGTAANLQEKEVMMQMLSNFGAQQGLSNTEYETSSSPLGFLGRLRGNKLLRAKTPTWFTYEVFCYAGHTSLMCLSVGAASANYPTQGIQQFKKSLRKF